MSNNIPPILLIIFNRPDKVKKLIEVLSLVKPRKIYIAADGPRDNRLLDKVLCERTRELIKEINWQCDIKTNFQINNLGCKIHVSRAITWFFDNIESGIILEDDCIPTLPFFEYCEYYLRKYNNHHDIMHINGTTFLTKVDISHKEALSHLSRYAHVWGWATWKRAWNKYDIYMKDLDEWVVTNNLIHICGRKKYVRFWINLFKHIRDKGIDTWDAQWQYTIFKNNGFVVMPHLNLIENIGFDIDATHTKKKMTTLMPVNSEDIREKNWSSCEIDNEADFKLMDKVYIRSIIKIVLDKLSMTCS